MSIRSCLALATSATVLCALIAAAPAPSAAVRAQAAPSDTLFDQQWSLRRGTVLGVQSAWNRVTGGSVVVAVIDTGVAVQHPDLRDNLWSNPREIPGNNVDDDGDGHIDDVHGWNFVAGNGDVGDDHGHGTAVAGVIAARGDNDRGVTGIAWRARIMALKALDAAGNGSDEAVAAAIGYAVAHGAAIINLSMATTEPSEPLRIALEQAGEAGVMITVAAGNQGVDIDTQPVYPAAYSIPRMIAVAATGPDGRLIAMSNRGAGHVTLAAPGRNIVSTAPGGRYQTVTGTSFAAPAAAAALVLLRAARPDQPPDVLLATLLATARRTGLPVASGSLDIAAAMRRSVGSLRPVRRARR